MKAEELKNQILNREVDSSFKVLKWSDNNFIALSYVRAIAECLQLELKFIDNFSSLSAFSLFEELDTYLNVMIVDKLTSKMLTNCTFENLESCIIICKSIDKDVSSLFVEDFIIELPEIKDWQISSYMMNKCRGLDLARIKWLQEVASNNIFRIDNELDKIALFRDSEQDDIFDKINAEDGYSDLTNFNIFSLIRAITSRKLRDVESILENISYIDIDAVGFVTLLSDNILKIIKIQTNPKATYVDLGISSKQFNAIKYSCGKIKDYQLFNLYEFLIGIDYKLKSGMLLMSNDRMLDYIVSKSLSYII